MSQQYYDLFARPIEQSGGSSTDYTNIAEMTAADTTDLTTGTLVYVDTTKCNWVAVVESNTGMADGITIVRSDDDVVTYYRDTSLAAPFRTVSAWYVNGGAASGSWGAGDDQNDGLSVSSPLYSIAEVNRRTEGLMVSDPNGGYFELFIGPSGAGTSPSGFDTLNLTVDCDIQAIRPGLSNESCPLIATGSVTAATARNRAANTQYSASIGATWTGWGQGNIYRIDRTQAFGRMYRETVASTTAEYTTDVQVGDTITAYSLPSVGAYTIHANGHYVGLSYLDLGSLFQIEGAYYLLLTSCTSSSNLEIDSCDYVRIGGTDCIAGLIFGGYSRVSFERSIIRQGLVFGGVLVTSSYGGGGVVSFDDDTGILAPIVISGGYRAIVGTTGNSVYFTDSGTITLSSSLSGYGATGASVDFGSNSNSAQYCYGSSASASAILTISGTNSWVTYVDKAALIATRAGAVFPWSMIDPGGVPNPNTGSTPAGSWPIGSTAAVKNPVGIVPR